MHDRDLARAIDKHTSRHKWNEVRVCAHCHGFVKEISCGDEGWSVCENCQQIEGDTIEMYENENGELITLEELESL
jgi:hypothetical protein